MRVSLLAFKAESRTFRAIQAKYDFMRSSKGDKEAQPSGMNIKTQQTC